jgi:glycine amidinotransferase
MIARSVELVSEVEVSSLDETPVVNAFNEWDPLEEVIVGVIEGSCVPTWHPTLEATMPPNQWDFYKRNGGMPFPKEQVEAARKNLEEFVHILESEGVRVRRPKALDHTKSYSTPDWSSSGGLYAAMPRDTLLAIGDEIIEAPMAWRSRYFEVNAFRPIIKEYFLKGARWSAGPKPQLTEDLYNYDYQEPANGGGVNYVITEFEPTFDAADFIKCGKDIFVQRSHVTNSFGIEWLQRHFSDRFRIHELKFNDDHPMHIDATFMPVGLGRLLVNPERVGTVPAMFDSWEILYCPKPCIPDSHPLYMTSKWINMNIIMLDEERVIVERQEESMIRAFKEWGFKPITCNFRDFNTFGGSFHCATLDIRRRGALESYF